MKTAIGVAVVAIAAFLYFRPAAESTKAPLPRSIDARAPAAPAGSIVVAPTISGRLVDRFKTGPNAQNDWKPNSGALKTGPNAQTELTPNIDRLKTGPNAQTDLTLKRSW